MQSMNLHRAKCYAAAAMQSTIRGGEGRSWAPESFVPPMFLHLWIFHIHVVEELAVPDMELIGGYSDDRPCGRNKLCSLVPDGRLANTVYIMHPIDLARVVAIAHNFVVGLIPPRESRQLWPWEVGEGAEIQAIHSKRSESHKPGYKHDNRYNVGEI